MKKLMFLISTEGKSSKQISTEAKAAFNKYQKVETDVSESPAKKTHPIPEYDPFNRFLTFVLTFSTYSVLIALALVIIISVLKIDNPAFFIFALIVTLLISYILTQRSIKETWTVRRYR